MKKLLSVVLALSLCLTAMMGCFTVSAAETNSNTKEETEATITVGNASAKAGENVAITVTGANFTDVCAAQLKITLPKELTLVSIFNGENELVNNSDGYDYAVKDNVINTVEIYNFTGGGETITTTSFVLTVNATVSATAQHKDYTIDAEIDGANIDEKWLNITVTDGILTVNHNIAYKDNTGDTHTPYCTGTGCDYVGSATAHTYTDGTCVCGKTEATDPVPEYSNIGFGTSPGALVYEPWTMILKIRVRDMNNGGASIPLSKFSDFGVYVLPSYLAETGATITNDYIIKHGKKMSSVNGDLVDDGEYYRAYYSGDLYTYMMGKDIYYLQYVVSNGAIVYRESYQTKTLEQVLDGAYSVSTSETEKALITSMKNLYIAVVAHRGDEYVELETVDIPRISDVSLPKIGSNTYRYTFGTSPGMKVIEPWAVVFKNRVKDANGATLALSELEDFGMILVKADTAPASAEDLISNESAYVFSNSADLTENGTDNYFKITFSDELYAYQMQDTFHYVRYFVKDGKLVCSNVTTKSMYDILVSAKSVSSESEIAVIDALIDLYEKVTAHRAS